MPGNRFAVSSLAGLAGIGLVFTLSGCMGGPAPAPGTTGGSPTPLPLASEAPGSTPTSPESGSSGQPPPVQPSSGTTPASVTSPLTLFYVALDDQGQSGPAVGCGDSIVATETGPVVHADPVEAAMGTLLKDKDAEHGQSGLLNTLSASDLEYVSASVSGDTVTVRLSGAIASGGSCDDPRVTAQLTHTAMAAAGTTDAKILVNGADLEEYLSQR